MKIIFSRFFWVLVGSLSLFQGAALAQDIVTLAPLSSDSLAALLGAPLDSVTRFADSKKDVEAQHKLGIYYLLSTPPNYPKALHYLDLADEQGAPGAAFFLGYIYQKGLAVHKDMKLAADYWQKAADGGLAEAMYATGMCYLGGKGREVKDDSTFFWIDKAAQNNLPKAKFLLGWLYSRGIGVEKNPSETFHWSYRAAQDGFPIAQLYLADMLMEGVGCQPNPTEAKAYLDKVSGHYAELSGMEKELFDSFQSQIADLLLQEKALATYGITYAEYAKMPDDDYRKTTRRMAEEGIASAQFDLGVLYYGGHRGTKKDYKQARYWLRLAAKGGNSKAKEYLRELGW